MNSNATYPQHRTRYRTAELNDIPFSSVVASTGASTRRIGSHETALCPLHDDHTPSMTIYHDRGDNHAYCHVCCKRLSVIDYAMARLSLSFTDACQWLSDRFAIPVDEMENVTKQNKNKRHPRKSFAQLCSIANIIDNAPQGASSSDNEQAIAEIPASFVRSRISTANSFCQCLLSIYPQADVERVTQLYRLGTYTQLSRPDDVLFPSITADGKVVNVKVQSYPVTDIMDARFLHNDKSHCFWLASILQRRGELPAQVRYTTDCLFGEHLLPQHPQATVCLVESPKNAIIGALEFPSYLWLATGNMGQFKPSVAKPLEGRNVIVIPDYNATDLWTQRAHDMRHIAHFVICPASQLLNTNADSKFDFADRIIADRISRILPF
ncbi:MAG: hypothetical protein KBT29_04610 [Prevotellaceae bacterium]|nr:hypothetical protein [Candidatus Minthosoma caballi]